MSHVLLVRLTWSLLGLTLLSTPALSQWDLEGVPVCTAEGVQFRPDLVPDESGGAAIFWIDGRNLRRELFAARITSTGALAPGWPENGLFLATGIGELWRPKGAPDGTGGAIIVWEDDRDFNNTNFNIYAQCVTGDGAIAAGWPEDGLAVCTAPRGQRVPRVIGDGTGGAYVVWDDNRDGPDQPLNPRPDIYAQRITANGEIAPGWPVDGLPICTTPEQQFDPTLALDEGGGVIISWADGRDLDVTGADIYAQRVLSRGELAPGWPVDGIPVCTAVGNQIRTRTVTDGSGGVIVMWQDARSLPGSGANDGHMDIYAQRMQGDGSTAPGWPENGVPLCTAPGTQQFLSAAPDGLGGALVAWEDYRNNTSGGTGADIYAQRVTGGGEIPPGWPADGVPVSTAVSFQISPDLAADGAGGAYVVWEDTQSGNEDVYAQHVTASGALAEGWPVNGLAVSTQPSSRPGPLIASDGLGGAIVAWADLRNGKDDIFAHKLGIDGPVPALLALGEVDVTAERVLLSWFGKDAGSLEATVYRRQGEGAWFPLGSPARLSPDQLQYEDRAIEPAARYGYRLGYSGPSGEEFTAETWVEVPAGVLSLAGFQPNPARGIATISFSLPQSGSASLQVFDLRGRGVWSREVGGLGAGHHRVAVETRLRPGIYWLRLIQGERTFTARGVVLE